MPVPRTTFVFPVPPRPLLLVVLAATGCAKRAPVDPGPPTVELVRDGKPVPLDAAAQRVLVARVTKAMEACTFSSETTPAIFGEPPEATWKHREARSHLRLRYATDKTLKAHFGELTHRELLLSVGEQYGPEPALAKGPKGVVGLKKCGYDDRFLGCVPELFGAFTPPAVCPPGLLRAGRGTGPDEPLSSPPPWNIAPSVAAVSRSPFSASAP